VGHWLLSLKPERATCTKTTVNYFLQPNYDVMAINEIQRIRQATHAYMYADERSDAFKDAVAYLKKVHATYGTIDPVTITELTR